MVQPKQKEILSLIKKYMHKELINYDYVEKNYKYLNDNHTLWRILNLLVWVRVFKVSIK